MATYIGRPTPSPEPAPGSGEYPSHVLQRYENTIRYYWRASARNKRAYKWTRYLTVVLGALVTLVASLSAANFLVSPWTTVFSIATPTLAFILTITAGLMQSFQ